MRTWPPFYWRHFHWLRALCIFNKPSRNCLSFTGPFYWQRLTKWEFSWICNCRHAHLFTLISKCGCCLLIHGPNQFTVYWNHHIIWGMDELPNRKYWPDDFPSQKLKLININEMGPGWLILFKSNHDLCKLSRMQINVIYISKRNKQISKWMLIALNN